LGSGSPSPRHDPGRSADRFFISMRNSRSARERPTLHAGCHWQRNCLSTLAIVAKGAGPKRSHSRNGSGHLYRPKAHWTRCRTRLPDQVWTARPGRGNGPLFFTMPWDVRGLIPKAPRRPTYFAPTATRTVTAFDGGQAYSAARFTAPNFLGETFILVVTLYKSNAPDPNQEADRRPLIAPGDYENAYGSVDLCSSGLAT